MSDVQYYSLCFLRMKIKIPLVIQGLDVNLRFFFKARLHYIFGSTNEKLYYKKYSNLLTKVKNLAKNLYYHQKLDDYTDNPKKNMGNFAHIIDF